MDERTWGLLAYALFSKHTRSSITEVSLQYIEMTQGHADAIAAVLTSDDPLKHLFGQQPGISGDEAATDASEGRRHRSARAMLKQGTAVTIQQMHPSETIPVESATWTLATDVSGVKIVDNGTHQGDKPTVSVLLPGYGLCKVPRDQLIEMSDEDGRLQRPQGGETKLKLNFVGGVEGAEGLPRFLSAVVSALTHLQLRTAANVSMRLLFAACPKLESLDISGRTVSATSFLVAYRASDARLSVLSCRFDEMSKIAKELADGRTRLAQTLRRLAYFSPSNYDFYEEDDHVKSVVKMLATNRRLQYVHLTIPRDVYSRNVDELNKHHNEVLPGIGELLPFNCRLASMNRYHSTAAWHCSVSLVRAARLSRNKQSERSRSRRQRQSRQPAFRWIATCCRSSSTSLPSLCVAACIAGRHRPRLGGKEEANTLLDV